VSTVRPESTNNETVQLHSPTESPIEQAIITTARDHQQWREDLHAIFPTIQRPNTPEPVTAMLKSSGPPKNNKQLRPCAAESPMSAVLSRYATANRSAPALRRTQGPGRS